MIKTNFRRISLEQLTPSTDVDEILIMDISSSHKDQSCFFPDKYLDDVNIFHVVSMRDSRISPSIGIANGCYTEIFIQIGFTLILA